MGKEQGAANQEPGAAKKGGPQPEVATGETAAEPAASTGGQEAGSGAAEAETPDADELRRQLEEARARSDEEREQLMRARAEIENLRRRHERELENAHKFALERFLTELLPVRDSLELGLSAAREEGADLSRLVEGKELTLKLLSDLMGRFNIEQVDPQGEPFNPDYHQAMSIQPRDDLPPNTVVTVVQKGYTLNGRLVRPAMVIVSQAAG